MQAQECARSYLQSCGLEGASLAWYVECSSGSPLSIEAKSPRQTADTQHQNPRNKSLFSTTPAKSALSRSDLVLEPKETDAAFCTSSSKATIADIGVCQGESNLPLHRSSISGDATSPKLRIAMDRSILARTMLTTRQSPHCLPHSTGKQPQLST